MAERIKKAFDINAVLVKGDDGIFDISVDGQVLFSKKSLGWFPPTEEVIEKIGQILKSKTG